jgi:hypothetical protein
MSTLKPHRECKSCERPMRTGSVAVKDAPGTVRHAGKGLCDTCRPRGEYTPRVEVVELCRWVPDGEYRVGRPEVVSGEWVSGGTRAYKLRIDGVVHSFPRPEWEWVIA